MHRIGIVAAEAHPTALGAEPVLKHEVARTALTDPNAEARNAVIPKDVIGLLSGQLESTDRVARERRRDGYSSTPRPGARLAAAACGPAGLRRASERPCGTSPGPLVRRANPPYAIFPQENGNFTRRRQRLGSHCHTPHQSNYPHVWRIGPSVESNPR